MGDKMNKREIMTNKRKTAFFYAHIPFFTGNWGLTFVKKKEKMEEIIFRALQGEHRYSTIDNFIQRFLQSDTEGRFNYEMVKESLIKLVLYRFIKIEPEAQHDCIIKRTNFYQALDLGGVSTWLAYRRSERC